MEVFYSLLSSRQLIFYILIFIVASVALIISISSRLIKKESAIRHYIGDEQSSKSASNNESVGKVLTTLLVAEKSEVEEKFKSAGYYKFPYAAYYMPAKYAVLLAGLVGIYGLVVKLDWGMSSAVIAVAFWLIIVVILPDTILARKAAKLRRKISNTLPFLLDLLGVCVQTGMTVEAALSYLSKEMAGFDRDLTHLITRTDERSKIVGLEKALDEMYRDVPTNEIRSFVMTLKQSMKYGTSIYQVLITLAVDIREVQMLGIEERIGKLSAKMSVPLILFIMLPIVILIVAPGIMRMLFND
ncbi:MAG: type II secretion system F family protein [Aliivibrio sp.]|uniref:type II secretion system F family protein n=1 Tax=Aliivibrio sp. TaxID=1872443 RepID=UPI001A5EC7D1|nr:type II secretion system F family protein [Aliivibrio sp.]